MDEAKLLEKLRLIEALHAATSGGERVAAKNARQRILERLASIKRSDPPIEYKFTFNDMWSKRVFIALLHRYGLTPFRYKRQRYTTVIVQVPKRFVEETLWPEFESLSETLHDYLSSVTDRVIQGAFGGDGKGVEIREKPLQLPLRGR